MADITANPGDTFTSVVDGAQTGLVGTINVRIETDDDTIVFGPSTTDIVESGTGIYTCDALVAPDDAGTYLVIWNDGTADANEPDVLTVTAIGTPICTIEQIDAILNRGGNADDYTDEQKSAARQAAQEAFEHEAGVAFTPRTETFTLDGNGTDLFLPRPKVTAVTAATISGEEIDVADMTVLADGGVLYYSGGFGTTRQSVQVTVTHGWTEPPADVSRAIALLASSYLADGPWDDRGYGVTEGGGGLVRLLTAGVSGAAFSIPEVQAALTRYRYITVL